MILLLLAPLLPQTLRADQNDARLDALFDTLRQASGARAQRDAENEIWAIWMQHNDAAVQQRLANGASAMENDPQRALAILSELTRDVPDFAEGWNKRATLYYLLGDYTASANDIDQTLALEPRHFGALSGLGLVYLAQSKYSKAKSAFEAVLKIHPHSVSARDNIEQINRYLRAHAV